MAFCTITQLTARYDKRFVGQISNDDNNSSINTVNVNAALDDATGNIKMAALQGSIYLESDLDALAAIPDASLVRLCADLALGHLVNRRAQGVDPALQQRLQESVEMLEKLRLGQRVFNVAANRTAEVPALVKLTEDELENLGSLTATDFFGGPTATKTTLG